LQGKLAPRTLSSEKVVVDRSELLTLVFSDLVGSTALKRERGDQAAGVLIARHRDLITSLTAGTGARIIDWAGDGCFLTFDAPSSAVSFGLSLQEAHSRDSELPQVRVGIHLGEVTVVGTKVEGLAVDLAARVCSLAAPGQVLVSRSAFDSARQRLRADASGQPIAWRAHGPYLLKGTDDPVEICEAGREGISPLAAPPDSEKARRNVSEAQEDTLGWRPAVGLHIPGRPNWVLEQPLGEGGFGEVWLAAHEKTRARRVFKFCFEPERIRGLRREVVLFRLLRETLGARPDIAQILDWQFDSAPFFIESEYTEGGDLKAWAEGKGGLAEIPLETRLELVAQAAEALGAAHSVGVLHKDIKPGNILITAAVPGRPQACLTDFGIGLITNRDALAGKNITSAGLTETLSSSSSTSGSDTGTRMYMAPELIEGKAASTLSDIYALGVVLYQVVSGDFSRSLAPGWERDVTDELLREDIAACVDGDPARRLASASELAKHLRSLAERRAAREKEKRLLVDAEKAHRRRQQFIVVTIIGVLVTIAVAVAAIREAGLRRQESSARQDAERAKVESDRAMTEAQHARDEAMAARAESDRLRKDAEYRAYVSDVSLAGVALDRGNAAQGRDILQRTAPEFRGWEWGNLALTAWPQTNMQAPSAAAAEGLSTAARWRGAEARLFRVFTPHKNSVAALAFSPDGELVASYGADGVVSVTAWNGRTRELWRKEGPYAGGGYVAFSHDGKFVAHPHNRDLVIADALTGEEIARGTGHTEASQTIGFTPDDSRFITASLDGSIRGWDTHSGREVWRLDGMMFLVDAAGTRYNPLLGFAQDGVHFIIGDGNGGFLFVDSSSGAITREIPLRLPTGSIPAGFSPSGEFVIGYDPKEISQRVFDINSGSQRKGPETYTATGDWSRNMVISRDGSLCFIRGSMSGVVPFDIELGTAEAAFQIISGLTKFQGMDALALSPDGVYLAVPQADGSIYIYTPADKKELGRSEMNQGAPVYVAHFDPVHRQLVSADLNGGFVAWDLDRRTMLHKWKGHADGITVVMPSRDYSRWLTHSYDGTYALWSADSVEPIATIENHIPKLLAGGANGPLVRLAASMLAQNQFSPDGSRIVVASGPTEARVLDAATLKPLITLSGLKAYATQSDFSPKGTFIVTHGYQEPTIRVWDAQTGKERFTLTTNQQIITTAISPDETVLVATSLSPDIFRWDLRDGHELPRITTKDTASIPVFFSPDGSLFATGGLTGTVSIWKTADGSLVADLTGHTQNALTCRFNPTGDRVLTLGMDKTVRVWDLRGNQLALFEFTDDIYYAEWSPDGTQFLVTTRDGSIRLLDSAPWADLEKLGEAGASIEDRLNAWRERGAKH